MDNINSNNIGDATNRGISGFGLKMIAIVTMLIDHIGAGIIEKIIMKQGGQVVDFGSWLSLLDGIFRCVGRMAFPIFIFLMVEGFKYTSNKYKYAGRMLLFAVLSEIPFDLAFNGHVLEFRSNNVFITLFLGLVTIMLLEYIGGFRRFLDASKSTLAYLVVHTIRFIGMAAVILGFMFIAQYIFSCDYGAAGVGAIVLMYLVRGHKMIGFAAMVVFLGVVASPLELVALLMLIPVYFYNGKRGAKVNKYVFYAFYPVHLLIIAGIAAMVV